MIESYREKSTSPEHTEEMARQFAQRLRGGEKVGLCGSLGMGKTRFMQGVGEVLALKVDEPLASPTFAILNSYELLSGGVLHHMDAYRLETWHAFLEMDGQGLLDSLDKRSFMFVEWADRYAELLRQMDWVIQFRELSADDAREIIFLRQEVSR